MAVAKVEMMEKMMVDWMVYWKAATKAHLLEAKMAAVTVESMAVQ